MNDTRLPALVYLLLLALGLLNWVHVYTQLPETVASHFTANGTANGWQFKPFFFLLMGVVVGMSALAAFVVPRQIVKMPAEKLNLPNKCYWLSPEHREETMRFLRARMAWFGCALLFVLLYATTQAINANLPSAGRFDVQGMLFIMAGFALFCVVWIIHFVRHFYKVPPSRLSAQASLWKE